MTALMLKVFISVILLNSGAAVRPVVTFTPNWGWIFTGEAITLTCNVDSAGQADQRYYWYRDQQSLAVYQKDYRITDAKEEYSGNYQCATSTSSTDESEAVRLDVSNGYVILQAPPNVYEGDDLSLRCHSYPGYKAKHTTFYRDNKVLMRLQYSASEISVQKVELEMSGTYKCTKSVKGHYMYYYEYSNEVYINVQELFSSPQIQINTYEMMEGEQMIVSCETLRSNTKLQFAFYRDGWVVQGFNLSNNYQVNIVQKENSGEYTCEVKTTSDTVKKGSDGITIHVQELFSSPQIQTNRYEMKEGEQMIMSCETSLHPLRANTKLQFAFYRDERVVQGFNLSNNYQVNTVQKEDSGNYTCEVKTLSDTVKKWSDGITIHVQELFSSPQIQINRSEMMEGEQMIMSCETSLHPLRANTKLQFAFYRDGRVVQGFDFSNNYQVNSIQKKNSGEYTCEASSDTVKKGSDGITIHVEESNQGVFVQNIVRLVLSACVLLLTICLVFHHMKTQRTSKP